MCESVGLRVYVLSGGKKKVIRRKKEGKKGGKNQTDRDGKRENKKGRKTGVTKMSEAPFHSVSHSLSLKTTGKGEKHCR